DAVLDVNDRGTSLPRDMHVLNNVRANARPGALCRVARRDRNRLRVVAVRSVRVDLNRAGVRTVTRQSHDAGAEALARRATGQRDRSSRQIGRRTLIEDPRSYVQG